MLKAAAAGAGALAAGPHALDADAPEGLPSRPTARQYLAGLARPDGGYAWPGQDRSHLTSTYAAVGCLHVLGLRPPNAQAVAEFLRTHHPAQLGKLEQPKRFLDFQQAQALVWLGADASVVRPAVEGWKAPLAYLKQYEQHGWAVFQSEMAAFTCRRLLGLPPEGIADAFTRYLHERRRDNGSFANSPASAGGDGHVMNTWWGLEALDTLGRAREKAQPTIDWLRACQLPSGGFTYQPKPTIAGWDDVAYTWAGVRALALLGSSPADAAACRRYLQSLTCPDGGFADRPGWQSNPLATYRAMDALSVLGAPPRAAEAASAPTSKPAGRRHALDAKMNVYSIQIEAHGTGSPAEAVDLARSLRIHLWGAKNASPQWLARAQALADADRAHVTFFPANEEYGTWLAVPGMGTYSHISDVIAPPGRPFGDSLAAKGPRTWPQFRGERLAPLTRARGRLVWQFGENEELTRLLLDDSLLRGGYAAISTFHFGNPDFTNSEPFLNRYRGQIPFVALQDAHGPEPWWFADMTEGLRTLFVAREPTWDAWLEALSAGRVAAVRHDAVSGMRTWLHAGSPELAEFLHARADQWRWWDNPAIRRPAVSIVALRPSDPFEAGRPAGDAAIRVRCAWTNTKQGQPSKPRTELVKLTVDGVPVAPELVTTPGRRGAAFGDHYHLHHLPNPRPGRHTASAVVRDVATRQESARAIAFDL